MVHPDQYWSESEGACELVTIVVKKHDATDESQLTLKVNDIVIVMEKDETGWWGGHKEGEEDTGWFPGICVQPLEGYEPRDSRRLSPGPLLEDAEAEQAQESEMRNNNELCNTRTAVETGTSSPARHSYAVASPQRTSAASAQGRNTDHEVQLNRLAEDRQSLLQQVEQLKQENRSLEEKLRRQSDCERRRYSQLEENFASLEAKNREAIAELKATRGHKNELNEANNQLQKELQVTASEKEQLQAEVRWSKEEMQCLSTKLEVERGRKSELSEEKDRLLRRVQELETPEPVQASAEERPPPAGVVKQLREAFEHAATERAATPTPRRPGLDRQPSKEQVTWPKVSVSAPTGAASQVLAGRCGGAVLLGHATAPSRRNAEEDSEFSPFHRGQKDIRAYPSEAPCTKTAGSGFGRPAVTA